MWWETNSLLQMAGKIKVCLGIRVTFAFSVLPKLRIFPAESLLGREFQTETSYRPTAYRTTLSLKSKVGASMPAYLTNLSRDLRGFQSYR